MGKMLSYLREGGKTESIVPLCEDEHIVTNPRPANLSTTPVSDCICVNSNSSKITEHLVITQPLATNSSRNKNTSSAKGALKEDRKPLDTAPLRYFNPSFRNDPCMSQGTRADKCDGKKIEDSNFCATSLDGHSDVIVNSCVVSLQSC